MILQIRYYGDPILRETSKEVSEFTPEIKQFIEDMITTLDSTSNGVGLSANQVGKLWRIFVIRPEIKTQDGEYVLGPPEVYVNPVLTSPSEEGEVMVEGCLSLPGLHAEVFRPLSITVSALGVNGKPFKEVVSGFKAREIMHENDHLNGKLFIDRLEKNERKRIERELQIMKKKYS